MQLSFHGAAGTVTGSCYLLDTGAEKIIIDAGMFQGEEDENKNKEQFDFDPAEVTAVIITHAHIDHSGLLPKLYADGFRGRVYMTPPTFSLCEILLLDSAKIQMLNSEHSRGGAVYYQTGDVINVLANVETHTFNEEFTISDNVRVIFFPAAHILGAASVYLTVGDRRILFSGDLGRLSQSIIEPLPLLSDLMPDYLIMESLYGGEYHTKYSVARQKFVDEIDKTIEKGGNVMIPSFAVHRTQEILLYLREAIGNGEIKKDVQIILDSPLADKATRIYLDYGTYFQTELQPLIGNVKRNNKSQNNLFYFDNVVISRTHRQSLRYGKRNNVIFIAGSGMVDGGRIVRHIFNNIDQRKHKILFVGYQAEGTMGREILEGAREISVRGKTKPVNAQIEYIDGFSGHADQDELNYWLSGLNTDKLQNLFLVHSESDRANAFKNSQSEQLQAKILIPKWRETFNLT